MSRIYEVKNMRYVHVQSVLPQEDVIALKAKTGESSVKEALNKAIYYYLKYGNINDNDIEDNDIKDNIRRKK